MNLAHSAEMDMRRPLAGHVGWVTVSRGKAASIVAAALASAGADLAIGLVDGFEQSGHELFGHSGTRAAQEPPSADQLDAILDTVAITGARGLGGRLDIGSSEALERFRSHVHSELGTVSILVNILSIGSARSTDGQEAAVTELNEQLEGMLRLTNMLLEPMVEKGWGRVITLVELLDESPATKAIARSAQDSLASLTRGMAMDVTPRGVACFLIGADGAADVNRLASLVLALCADQAVSLSGQTVMVLDPEAAA